MTPNPICRLFYPKIYLLTDFAALCLTDFIDWRYIHSWFVFLTQLVNCCPHGGRNHTCVLLSLYLLSDLPPFPKLNVQYIQTVCVAVGGGGWGMSNCVVDHILQEFHTLFLTRFRTYKIASPPQTKMTSKDDIKGFVSLNFLRPCPTTSPPGECVHLQIGRMLDIDLTSEPPHALSPQMYVSKVW
jgi:hypothetical protein